MPRRSRLHVPEGVYYIILRSNPQRHIFSHASDYEDFELFLTSALTRCRVSAHAFSWQTDTARLVVQISDISVGRFVQRVTSQYARSVHKHRGGSGHLFQQRYHAVLIDPETYLLRLIHYLHLLPPGEGAINGVDANRLTSHSVYLGNQDMPWLNTDLALRMLAGQGRRPEVAYDELMRNPPDPHGKALFERTSIQVLGDRKFIESLPGRQAVRPNHGNLDHVIDVICWALHLERQAVTSKSRQRKLALARALITWHAIDRGIASLAEVARKLHRDPSTLFVAMERYRVLRPELFDRKWFDEMEAAMNGGLNNGSDGDDPPPPKNQPKT